MPLRRVHNIAGFLQSNDDRYLLTAQFMAWRQNPNLVGFHIWGNDGCHLSFEVIVNVMDFFAAAGSRQRVLFDNTGCTDSTLSTYSAAFEIWRSRRERYSAISEQLAVVVPEGLVGAILLGLVAQLDLRQSSVRLFDRLASAAQWIESELHEELVAELQALRPATQEHGFVERLHGLLLESRYSTDVAGAARRLGMSERTLQRRLSRNSTTFLAEVSRAKLTRARQLMISGTHNMTEIALELGFASPQHFSARFRAAYGKAPSTWLRNYLDSGQAKGDAHGRVF